MTEEESQCSSVSPLDGEKRMKDSSISSTSSSRGTGPTGASQARGIAPLAFRETRWLAWSKALVVLVIAFAATIVAVATYRRTTKAEEQNFETRVSLSIYGLL